MLEKTLPGNVICNISFPLLNYILTTEDYISGAREGINALSPKDPLLETNLSSSSEETIDETDEFTSRGRPDGVDNEDKTVTSGPSDSLPKVNKIKELMANWENKPERKHLLKWMIA